VAESGGRQQHPSTAASFVKDIHMGTGVVGYEKNEVGRQEGNPIELLGVLILVLRLHEHCWLLCPYPPVVRV